MTSREPLLDLSSLDALRDLPSSDPRGMLAHVVDLFRVDAQSLLQNLDEALRTGRLDLARSHAHALKSYAGTVGALQLRSVLESLERSVRMGDDESARKWLSDAARVYAGTVTLLDAEVASVGPSSTDSEK